MKAASEKTYYMVGHRSIKLWKEADGSLVVENDDGKRHRFQAPGYASVSHLAHAIGEVIGTPNAVGMLVRAITETTGWTTTVGIETEPQPDPAKGFRVTTKIPHQHVADCIVNGFDCNAIGYWAHKIERVQKDGPAPVPEWGDEYCHGHPTTWAAHALYGEGITITDEDGTSGVLSPATIQKAIDILAASYPARIHELVENQDDVETADVLIQFAVFGEMVYG